MIPLIFGIGTAMTSIVGANIGAKNIIRAETVGIYGGTSAGVVSIFMVNTGVISRCLDSIFYR